MLMVFDTHPVQYRVPIWQEVEKQRPGTLHVVYASDCSVRGYRDVGFGQAFSWDEPLLSGYSNSVLNCERGEPFSGWGSFTGHGVNGIMNQFKPSAVLLTGLNYRYDLAAYISALRMGIPVWLRCETQDEAVARSGMKSLLRSVIYRLIYSRIQRFFFIGELNRIHYLRHGVAEAKLVPARYATVDRFAGLNEETKLKERVKARKNAAIGENDIVVGFSGKFIPKKNPGVLMEMIQHLPQHLRERICLYFIGSGELEDDLSKKANHISRQYGVRSHFTGFLNQTELAPHYLAMDILVLPSRRMGETWGLVANEAMQAGCAVVVSDAVGCGADFNSWERFRVFKEGDPAHLAIAVEELSNFDRGFSWASEKLQMYSMKATVDVLIDALALIRE